MIRESAEVRWFFGGPVEPAVADWISRGRAPLEEEREDRYLVLPALDTIGVKLRDSGDAEATLLEVKTRRGDAFHLDLGAAVGRAAAWVKATVPLPGQPAAAERRLLDSWAVARVHKRRLRRRLELVADGLREVSVATDTSAGCDIELASITIDSQPWWSVGLEAFGPRASVRDHLTRLGPVFLELLGNPPVALDAEASASYAAWVSKLASQLQRASAPWLAQSKHHSVQGLSGNSHA